MSRDQQPEDAGAKRPRQGEVPEPALYRPNGGPPAPGAHAPHRHAPTATRPARAWAADGAAERESAGARATGQRARGARRTAPAAGAPVRVPILMYHAIAPHPSPAAHRLSVSPEAFAAQLEVLVELGCTPVTTRQLADAWRGRRRLPARPVLLTFDDGYEGVHRHALPALAAHGLTASLFVSTGWLPGRHYVGQELDTMLTWGQVRELAAYGVEIGGHSHTHPQLDQLAAEPLREEVTRCAELLAEETGRVPVSFAYPFGYSTRRVREAVRAAGFAQSLAVNNRLAGTHQSPYALTRLTVRRSTSLVEFRRLLRGRGLAVNYAADHVLGKGYATVRAAHRAVRALGLRSADGRWAPDARPANRGATHGIELPGGEEHTARD